MSDIQYVIWFVLMTLAVAGIIVVGVFGASGSFAEHHARREAARLEQAERGDEQGLGRHRARRALILRHH